MKNYFFVLAVLTAFTFNACNDDETSGIPKNTHRVKTMTDYYNNSPDFKLDFTYDGEKLVEIMGYGYDDEPLKDDEPFKEVVKVVITYDGNNATAIVYDKDDENWEQEEKLVYTVEDNLLKQEKYYEYDDGNWDWDGGYTYTYSGKNLVSYQYMDDDPNDVEEKGEFEYDGDKVVKAIYYDVDDEEMEPHKLDSVFTYSGDNLTGWISYYNYEGPEAPWDKYSKYEYSYTGDNVNQIMRYKWDEGEEDWIPSEWGTKNYTYDENGFLITQTSGNSKTEYEYEEGNGNASLFPIDEDMYPLISIYQKPTLKNASKVHKYIPFYQRFRNLK